MAYPEALEDVRTCIELGVPHRVPAFPLCISYDYDYLGYTHAQIRDDPHVMLELARRAVAEFDYDVYMLHPIPEDGRPREVAKEKRLAPGEIWASAEELGGYGPVLDQDTPNMLRMTKGLKTMRKPGMTLANYQENRIRHLHRTLDEYMADGGG